MAEERRPTAPQVEVTLDEDLIRRAINEDSSHCMWAEAVKRAVPHAQRVSVDLATIRFTDPKKGLRYTYLTPRFAQQSLVDFDQGDDREEYVKTYAGLGVRLRGGIVTLSRSGRRGLREVLNERPRSEGQRRAAAENIVKARAGLKLKNQRLVLRDRDGRVPDRVGGTPPPTGAKGIGGARFGTRRSFGIRGLR